MHILLITSEVLNPNNVYASCFELAQAKALQTNNIHVGILSINAGKTGINNVKLLIKKILFKKIEFSFAALLSEIFYSAFNSFYFKTNKHFIQGINVYEGCFIPGFFNQKNFNYDKYIRTGLLLFKKYRKDFGSPDIIHAHSRFLVAPLIAEKIKKKFGVKYLITEHSSFYARNMINAEQKDLCKQVIKNAEFIITVSDSLGYIIKEKLQMPEFRWKVVPNLIDELYQTEYLPAKELDKTNFIFLSIGSLDTNKNHKLIIDAIKLLPKEIHTILRIIGEGSELANLQNQVLSLKLEGRVMFMGHLSKEEVRKEILNSNALIISSIYETFSVVTIEALSCGKPVISTKCGGPEEIINSGNGILIQNNTKEELSAAMFGLIKNIDNYNSEKIREECLSKYSSQIFVKKVTELYLGILHNN